MKWMLKKLVNVVGMAIPFISLHKSQWPDWCVGSGYII